MMMGKLFDLVSLTTRARRAIAVGVTFVGGAFTHGAHAEEVAFPVDLDNPKASVPPEEQRLEHPAAAAAWVREVRQQAEAAEAARDWPKAVRFYQALSFGEPDSAWAYGKLCDIHEGPLGEPQQAEHYCWAGVKRADATLADRYHFLDLAFAIQVNEDKGGVKVRRAQMIYAVVEDLKSLAAKEPKAVPSERTIGVAARYLPLAQQREVYACQLAAMAEAALDPCLKDAAAAGVPDSSLLPFQWAHARASGDDAALARVEAAAKRAGVLAADLKRLAVGGRDQAVKVAPAPTVSGVVTLEQTPAAAPSARVAPTIGAVVDEAESGAKVSGGLPLEEGIAVGAAALGVAALAWLVVDRGRKAKSVVPVGDSK